MTPQASAALLRCVPAAEPKAVPARAPAITRDGGTDVVFI